MLGVTIRDAKERFVIVSAFLSVTVVDRSFLQQLEGALRRGVRVWIAYGMGSQGENDRARTKQSDWRQAEAALTELRKRYKDLFQLKDLGNTHEKILLCDNDFVVSGSFNWLSFRGGTPGKRFRYEDALLVKDPEAIEEYFKEITGRFADGK